LTPDRINRTVRRKKNLANKPDRWRGEQREKEEKKRKGRTSLSNRVRMSAAMISSRWKKYAKRCLSAEKKKKGKRTFGLSPLPAKEGLPPVHLAENSAGRERGQGDVAPRGGGGETRGKGHLLQ